MLLGLFAGDPTWESKCAVVDLPVSEFLDWCSASDDTDREVKRRKLDSDCSLAKDIKIEHPGKESVCSHLDSVESESKQAERGAKESEDNALNGVDQRECFAYASYLYLKDLFSDDTETLQQFDWSVLGLANRDGRQTTMWLGSAGANTPCHRDAYGWNAVAQLFGTKRWTLFAPSDTASMYATRVPFEETSTYSMVNVASPDLLRFPRFADSHPYCTDLHPGDVLIMPARWWHFVESLDSPTFSVNIWTEIPSLDRVQRCNEALVKFVVNAILHGCADLLQHDSSSSSTLESSSDCVSKAESSEIGHTSSKFDIEKILNPNEHIESAEALLSYVRSAFNDCNNTDTGLETRQSSEVASVQRAAMTGNAPIETDSNNLSELRKRFQVECLVPHDFSDWLASHRPAKASNDASHTSDAFVAGKSPDSHADAGLVSDLVFAFTHDSVIERVRELVCERRAFTSSVRL